MNTINDAVLDGLPRAVDEAERNFKALVLWQTGEPFSAGADLKGVLALLKAGRFAEFETMTASFQRASMRLKHSLVPVVAAIRGIAFGGGCEFQMHCDAHGRGARKLHRARRSRRRLAACRAAD